MFDIVTIEPSDIAVREAVNVIISREAFIQVPTDGYRYIALNDHLIVGNGGSVNSLAVVGHAGPDTLSGQKTWDGFTQHVTATVDPDWRKSKKTVYLIACSTAGAGTKFFYKNIADEIKANFPGATIWASSTAVSAIDLSGDWVRL